MRIVSRQRLAGIFVGLFLWNAGFNPVAAKPHQPIAPVIAIKDVEYKLLLKADSFVGSPATQKAQTPNWELAQTYLDTIFGDKKVKISSDDATTRTVTFYDTGNNDFLNNKLLFRTRSEKDSAKGAKKGADVTLKCRTDSVLLADLGGYIAEKGAAQTPELGEERILLDPKSDNPDPKSANIVSRFSMDTKLKENAAPKTLKEAGKSFPGLKNMGQILGLKPSKPLKAMSVIEVEVVFKGGNSFSSKSGAKEGDLTFWFDASNPKKLLIVEISFKLGAPPSEALLAAGDALMREIRTKSITSHYKLSPVTSKTRIAYGVTDGTQSSD